MAKVLMVPTELLEKDLTGKRAIVTGANSGIGAVTAEQLAKQGAHVVLACRRVDSGQRVAQEIRERNSEAQVVVMELDLGRLASVRAFAKKFTEEHSHLHYLVNNAGVMNTPESRTEDGFETQFGVNHLGHFLLTELLVDTLKRSAPARIVNLSSCFHDKAMGREGDIYFEDISFESKKYDGWAAYAQSKLANLLHAKELAERLAGTGVAAVSVHPGWVRSNLSRHSIPGWAAGIVNPVLRLMGMIEPWEGAQSSLFALLAPDVPEHAGEFYSQVGVYRDKSKQAGGWPLVSPNPNAHDMSKARRLRDVSFEMVGLLPVTAAAE